MRADLLDAVGAVEWGESQLPILGNRFRAWEAENAQLTLVDLNPPTGKFAAVASAKSDIPAILHAEVGAIIGSFRSALDLLGAALAARNGVSLSRDTHFPIFDSMQDMVDPLRGIKREQWLSAAEIAVIKSLCPYEGGNDLLWSLHKLDILRKHYRLIACMVSPRIDYVLGRAVSFPVLRSDDPRDLIDKPVLFEYPRNAAKPEAQFSVEITFNEILPAVYRKSLFPTLIEFRDLTLGIIERFDTA